MEGYVTQTGMLDDAIRHRLRAILVPLRVVCDGIDADLADSSTAPPARPANGRTRHDDGRQGLPRRPS